MPHYYPDTCNYYRYYDTPDGCDIPQKTMVTTRYGVMLGFALGTFDALMYSHAIGLGSIIKRYAFHCIPLGAMGATFSLVSNGLVRFREKDDPLNYFLGGLACGPIAARYLGSMHAVLLGGLALGVAGAIKKDGVQKGWTFFPTVQRMTICWDDYTIKADPRDEMLKYCPKTPKTEEMKTPKKKC